MLRFLRSLFFVKIKSFCFYALLDDLLGLDVLSDVLLDALLGLDVLLDALLDALL